MEHGERETGVVVNGTGRVAIEPEIATLNVGVSLVDESLAKARGQAASKITAARDQLLASGVDQSDIKTTRLNVHSSFDRDRRLQTYHLSTGLEVIIRDLGSAESIVNELFAAIGDGMDMRGLIFGVEDPTTGRDEALGRAFADARAKAKRLAELAGVRLGSVLYLSENVYPVHQPRPMMRAMSGAAEAAEIPIEAGELDQEATVSVRWAIDT